MTQVQDGCKALINGEIRLKPPDETARAVPAEGVLKPKRSPAVEIDIATIWPD